MDPHPSQPGSPEAPAGKVVEADIPKCPELRLDRGQGPAQLNLSLIMLPQRRPNNVS
jgi:hypothetical protein